MQKTWLIGKGVYGRITPMKPQIQIVQRSIDLRNTQDNEQQQSVIVYFFCYLFPMKHITYSIISQASTHPSAHMSLFACITRSLFPCVGSLKCRQCGQDTKYDEGDRIDYMYYCNSCITVQCANCTQKMLRSQLEDHYMMDHDIYFTYDIDTDTYTEIKK